MRVNWQQELEGCSLLEIRNILRRVRGESSFTVQFIAEQLEAPGRSRRRGSLERAERLAQGLVASGLIEPDEDRPASFQLTDSGLSLRAASATRRFKRARAERAIDELLRVVAAINADPIFLHDVSWVAVFGSYLSGEPELGDTDLAVTLQARWKPHLGLLGVGGQKSDREKRIEKFERQHPPPASFYKRMWWASWPETYTRRLLRVDPAMTFIERLQLEELGCPHRQILPEVVDVPAKPEWSVQREEIVLRSRPQG